MKSELDLINARHKTTRVSTKSNKISDASHSPPSKKQKVERTGKTKLYL